MTHPEPLAGTTTPYPPARVAWKATLLLSLLYWLSILDRFIIALLVDPIKADLAITDFQFSLLHGLAFTVTYALFGLLAGVLADRFSRRWIICWSVAIWSVATAACGVVQSFWQLLIARIGVGAGEAGLNPSATSMLTDLFPRERLTAAMAVYTIGASIGSGMAYMFGGVLIDWIASRDTLSLPLLGELRSWQAVFLIIGIPGALLSLAIFSVPEPRRRDQRLAAQQSQGKRRRFEAFRQLLAFMRPRWRFFLPAYCGFALAAIVLAGGAIWYPAHMSRAFGWSPGEIGLWLGMTLVISACAGKIIGGLAMDALFRRGVHDAQPRWFACSLLIAIPLGVVATTSDSPWVFLVGIGLFFTLLAPLPACYNTALNLVTPNELRGTGIAFYAATAGMLGSALGPILVAAFADHVFDGGGATGKALATATTLFCPLAAIALFLGCRPMRDCIDTVNDWLGEEAAPAAGNPAG